MYSMDYAKRIVSSLNNKETCDDTKTKVQSNKWKSHKSKDSQLPQFYDFVRNTQWIYFFTRDDIITYAMGEYGLNQSLKYCHHSVDSINVMTNAKFPKCIKVTGYSP